VPYVSNTERIVLGLQGYGSDVPQDVLDQAKARWEQLQGDRETLEKAGPTPRKRARKANGQLKGDDPATPDKNEAWEDG